MARTCVFCGGTPVTREHVWPQWLQQFSAPQELLKLELLAEPVIRARTEVGEDGRYRHVEENYGNRKPLISDLTVKVVCSGCNSGWMNDLEKAVQPTLRRLAAKKGHSLTTKDQAAISAWMFKTALMYAYWDPGNSPFRPAIYRRFFQTRRIPETTLIWLSRCDSRWAQMAMAMRNMRGTSFFEPRPGQGALRNNSTAVYLAVEGIALLMHHSSVIRAFYIDLPESHCAGWTPIYPSTEDCQWPREPIKERSLLESIDLMGSYADPTPGVDIEGLTPEEVERLHHAHFVERLMYYSETGPEKWSR